MRTPAEVQAGLERLAQELTKRLLEADSLQAMQSLLDALGWPYGPLQSLGQPLGTRVLRLIANEALILATRARLVQVVSPPGQPRAGAVSAATRSAPPPPPAASTPSPERISDATAG